MGKFNLQTEERQMSTVSTLSAIRLWNKEFSDRLQAQFTANISCNVSQLLEGKFIFFLWDRLFVSKIFKNGYIEELNLLFITYLKYLPLSNCVRVSISIYLAVVDKYLTISNIEFRNIFSINLRTSPDCLNIYRVPVFFH